jgi:8-hydroxy-5-deazaflavin:NADPH oxidoreductase
MSFSDQTFNPQSNRCNRLDKTNSCCSVFSRGLHIFLEYVMKVAVLGTGQVAIALAKGFASRGHTVVFGTRDVQGKTALEAVKAVVGSSAALYPEAAKSADMAVVTTSWSGTQNALQLAGAANLAGKLVIDVTNPLDFSSGKPTLALGFPNSAGQQIQQWLPEAQVVKAFNIISSTRMVDPQFEEGHADMFIAGNDATAKAKTVNILKSFGWHAPIDMGDISKAYLLEALAMTWIEYGATRNHWTHGFSLLSAQK